MYRFRYTVVFILIFCLFQAPKAYRRRGGAHNHPQDFGFGQQQESFGHHHHQHGFRPSQYPSQMEYGGLNNDNDYEGEIQQVSENDEDLSGFIRQTIKTPRNPIPPPPPKYTNAPDEHLEGHSVSESPEAITPKGTFIGKKEMVEGKAVYTFYGIPYGKPPTGKLRFKRPEPADRIEEPYNATTLPDTCPQAYAEVFPDFYGEQMWQPNTNMSENCLFLNIWVPATVFEGKENKQVPVMFWIYGGGYFSGSSSLDVYNGAGLAAIQDIVVVNVQYRLGPLGFLYFGNDDAPGNMGLLDQSLGLKWTRENIEYFGGNPNEITLAGESCGAASVGFHLVSPVSKNLFKRGIMTSGLPNAGYALKSPEVMKSRSYKLAKLAGCNQESCKDIAECLRQVDSEKLNTLQWKLYKDLLDFPMSPTIDGYFLPDEPDNLIKKGKAKRAPLIMGTVRDEGSYFILYHYVNYIHHLKPTNIPRDRFVEIMEELFHDYSESEREAIIDEYTNWENPEDGYANQKLISDAVGDAYFVCPHRKFADNWSNRGLSVYYYHYTERSKMNPWGEWMGVMHGDDIPLLFGEALTNSSYPESEKMMALNFVDMVGNFIRTGIPSHEWERYTSEHPVYLDVNATKVSKLSTPNLHGPRPSKCAFWNKLLPMISTKQDCSGHGRSGSNKSGMDHNPPNNHQEFAPQWNNHGQGIHGGQGFYQNDMHNTQRDKYQYPQNNPHHCPISTSPPSHSNNNNHLSDFARSRDFGHQNTCRDYPSTSSSSPTEATSSTSCKCTVSEKGTQTNDSDETQQSQTNEFITSTPPPL